MIGFVSPSLQPLLRVKLRVSEHEHEIEGVVDTGFSSFLTLPSKVLELLQATPFSEVLMKIADGSEVAVRTFLVEVFWDEIWKTIEVIEANNVPLIGMALLENCSLQIEVRDGGRVLVESL